MTLEKVNGRPIGEHSLIKRLMKGAFEAKPPARKKAPLWDPRKVLQTFQQAPDPLSIKDLIHKAAFIIAIVTGKRHSELHDLKSDNVHLTVTDSFVQFVPHKLSKTDRLNFLGDPFAIAAWSQEVSLCPVRVVTDLLSRKRQLLINHDSLFFSWDPPHPPLPLATFRNCILRSLRDAGIAATPGSTRSTAASLAFARGATMADIMGMGSWTRPSTFLRHYANF